MTTDELIKYPSLSLNETILEKVIVVKGLKQKLDAEQEGLQKLIKSLQDSCEHVLIKNFVHDKSYIWSIYSSGDGESIMKGEECLKCGLFKPRPEGSPWVICHKCGGEMEYDGKTPGQGGDGRHIYHCKKCNHAVSHT